MGLVAGILMVILAFWTAGQFFVEKAYVLLVFAGIWALMQGLIDIIRRSRSASWGRWSEAGSAVRARSPDRLRLNLKLVVRAREHRPRGGQLLARPRQRVRT